MPNQQSWMFRWVFSVVFPRLIPKHVLSKVRIVITDGDPQEYSQVDNAIESVFPNAKRVQCGWHIVYKGFEKYIDMTFPDIPTTIINDHKKIIQNWMYSWMKRTCWTYLEYKYSRYLFMKYIFLSQVVNLFGLAFLNNVAMFVRKHVLLHEKYFLYCQRSQIRHYGEYSNTPLEGTNFALKHSSISTHPGLSMDSSMVILSLLSDKHVQKVNSNVIKQNKRQCMNYGNEVHDKLTVRGSSMVSNLVSLTNRYKCIRVNAKEWKVRKMSVGGNRKRGIMSCIPDFDVLQTVGIIDTANDNIKQLRCSCTYTTVYGLPCVHSWTVAKTFEPNWTYINHNDVSVRWLKSYYLYSLPETIIPDVAKQQKIKQVFRSIRKHEVVGIHIEQNWYADIPIHTTPLPEEYQQPDHIVKCMNYPDSDKVTDFDPYNSNLDGTTSQVTEIGTQLSDEDDDAITEFINANVTETINSNVSMKSYYSQLQPNFVEAVNWVTNQQDADQLKQLFDKFISDVKSKYKEQHPVSEEQIYVSSNMPIETAKQHHGCTGWSESRKRKKMTHIK